MSSYNCKLPTVNPIFPAISTLHLLNYYKKNFRCIIIRPKENLMRLNFFKPQISQISQIFMSPRIESFARMFLYLHVLRVLRGDFYEDTLCLCGDSCYGNSLRLYQYSIYINLNKLSKIIEKSLYLHLLEIYYYK